MVGQNRVHNGLCRSGPATLHLCVFKFLSKMEIGVLCAILDIMCECVSAMLEQVAEDRLMYICAGFGCAVVAIGFTIGEFQRMKKEKMRIGFPDLLGLIAAILQVIISGVQVFLNRLRISFPIKFSIFSLIFAIVFGFYKLIWKPHHHHPRSFMYCKESTHFFPLKMCDQIHPTKTLLGCPFCAGTHKYAVHWLGMDDSYVSIPISSLQDAPSEVGAWIYNVVNKDVAQDPPSPPSKLSQDTRGRARISDSDVEARGSREMIGRQGGKDARARRVRLDRVSTGHESAQPCGRAAAAFLFASILGNQREMEKAMRPKRANSSQQTCGKIRAHSALEPAF
ncbi:hypothetical protein RHSIM_Rhsim06G0024200 [Rhododendron simsii]|uniref:Uncharacterized protein n=1 Tax=Rhododendron simsii TaxID=118357 RepID=A0A834GV36_RHOSS|nr:hypothetical protein RHSIM_Rhsim06G0024200 [Rhododendron simsii]